jgi:drug/metabolite transporter (DMT)-like permease
MAVAYRQSLQIGATGTNCGLATAVLSAAMFGTSGSLAASLLHAGWSPAAAVSIRLLVAAVVLTVPASIQLRRCDGAWRAGGRTIIVFGLVPVAGCQLCYFEAIRHLSVAVALLLEYSGILLVVAWQWLRHRQAPGRRTTAGALVAIIGLALVLDLSGRQHVDLVGVAWGLGAAVGLAVYFVVSASGQEPLPPLVVAWGGLAVGAAAMLIAGGIGILPLASPHVQVVLAHTRVSWLVPVLGLGIVAAALAYVTGIAAARALGARVASFVGLCEVVFAVIYAWLLLGQRLAPTRLAGGALVLAGIALVRADRTGQAAGESTSDCRPDPGGGSPLALAGGREA